MPPVESTAVGAEILERELSQGVYGMKVASGVQGQKLPVNPGTKSDDEES